MVERFWRPFLLGLALLLLGVTSPQPYGNPKAPFKPTIEVTVKKIDRQHKKATVDVRERTSRCGVMTEAPPTQIFLMETAEVQDDLRYAHVSHTFCDVSIAIEATPALIYPFDTATIPISPDGCANAEECPDGGGLYFPRIDVSLSDALWQDENFDVSDTAEGSGINLYVRRHFFLMTMTVYVFAIVVVFDLSQGPRRRQARIAAGVYARCVQTACGSGRHRGGDAR